MCEFLQTLCTAFYVVTGIRLCKPHKEYYFMSNMRKLTAEEESTVKALNDAVTEALQKRKAYLDQLMHEASEIKVGDTIYDQKTGQKLGVVSKLYRYQAEQNPLYDTSHYCEYEYSVGRNSFDNTSRQIGLRIRK